jgi:hypothetical protein
LSDEEPDEILVERALEEICNSDTFDGAPKRRQLLWYLVQAFLDKKKVDETSVAVEIYGRDPKEFNPKLDSIARVERGKLQKQLAKYFATEGDWLPIRIRLDGFLAIPEFKESTDDNSSKTHHAIPAPLPYKAFENVYVTQLHERRLRLPLELVKDWLRKDWPELFITTHDFWVLRLYFRDVAVKVHRDFRRFQNVSLGPGDSVWHDSSVRHTWGIHIKLQSDGCIVIPRTLIDMIFDLQGNPNICVSEFRHYIAIAPEETWMQLLSKNYRQRS